MQPKTTANLMEELLQARQLTDYLENGNIVNSVNYENGHKLQWM